MARLIPGEGPKNCRVAIIGEAPGADEERLNRPFVGRSGMLLDRLLNSAGLLRSSCYITNVVKERPADNDIGLFLRQTTKGPVATSEYTQYENSLYAELSDCTANVYVCLGNTALYALVRRFGIGRLRGSILAGSINGRTVKVVPTLHPAAALREPTFSYMIALDLKRAAQESASPEVVLPVRNMIVEPDYATVIGFLDEADSQHILACDIETSNDQVHCISFALRNDYGISIPFVSGGDYFNAEQESEIWRRIAVILENPNITKVFQNAMFDAAFLLNRYGIRTWPIEDTMIAQAIVAPELPKGLDFITSVYTNEPYYKDEGKKWFKIGGDLRAFWLYNAKDSAVCLEALPKIKEELLLQGNLDTYKRVISLLPSLLYMQQRGLRVAVDALRAASQEADERIKQLQATLDAQAGRPLNTASPKQMKEFFYGTRRYHPYVNRKTGSVSVDEKALERMRSQGSPEATTVLAIRELAKLKGTYYDIGLDQDRRLRGAYNPVGTVSGRLSSRKTIFDTGGNLQNLPSDFKRFILADEGYVLYEKDLSQAENRIVAYVAPEPSMIEAFESGVDVHRRTASLIFSVPEAEITKAQRQLGKVANHGLNYDMSANRFSLEYALPLGEAKFIVNRYHEIYPGIRRWHKSIQDQLNKSRTLTNLLGRKRKFFGIWSDDLFKEAYNYIPQSTVGDKINRDGLIFIYDNQDAFYAVELLNQIHDSIVFQIPISVSWEYHANVLQQIDRSMSSPLEFNGRVFSIPSDTSIGINLADKIKVDLALSVEDLAHSLSNSYDTLTKGTAQ